MVGKYSVLSSGELLGIIRLINEGKTTLSQIARAKRTKENTVTEQMAFLKNAGLIVSKSRLNTKTGKIDKRFKHFENSQIGFAKAYFKWVDETTGQKDYYDKKITQFYAFVDGATMADYPSAENVGESLLEYVTATDCQRFITSLESVFLFFTLADSYHMGVDFDDAFRNKYPTFFKRVPSEML